MKPTVFVASSYALATVFALFDGHVFSDLEQIIMVGIPCICWSIERTTK